MSVNIAVVLVQVSVDIAVVLVQVAVDPVLDTADSESVLAFVWFIDRPASYTMAGDMYTAVVVQDSCGPMS